MVTPQAASGTSCYSPLAAAPQGWRQRQALDNWRGWGREGGRTVQKRKGDSVMEPSCWKQGNLDFRAANAYRKPVATGEVFKNWKLKQKPEWNHVYQGRMRFSYKTYYKPIAFQRIFKGPLEIIHNYYTVMLADDIYNHFLGLWSLLCRSAGLVKTDLFPLHKRKSWMKKWPLTILGSE